MIIDTLEHFDSYASVNPAFPKVAEFLRNVNIETLEEGKHDFGFEGAFVNIQMAKGKTRQEAVLETHRKMLDIQIPLSAPETFGYTPLSRLPEGEYNEAKDITKFPGLEADDYVTCHKGMFAIFFPQDGHAPCIADTPQIKKAIFKIPV